MFTSTNIASLTTLCYIPAMTPDQRIGRHDETHAVQQFQRALTTLDKSGIVPRIMKRLDQLPLDSSVYCLTSFVDPGVGAIQYPAVVIQEPPIITEEADEDKYTRIETVHEFVIMAFDTSLQSSVWENRKTKTLHADGTIETNCSGYSVWESKHYSPEQMATVVFDNTLNPHVPKVLNAAR